MISLYDLAIVPTGASPCIETDGVIASTRSSPEGYKAIWQKSFS